MSDLYAVLALPEADDPEPSFDSPRPGRLIVAAVPLPHVACTVRNPAGELCPLTLDSTALLTWLVHAGCTLVEEGGRGMNAYFDMCVNDYHGYGQSTGHLRAAHFHLQGDIDMFIHLDCVDREIICRKLDDKTIRVGRLKFPILAYRCYVGNMMWDSALVTVETANRIADKLRACGQYQPDHATTELWERWDAGLPLFEAQPAAAADGSGDA